MMKERQVEGIKRAQAEGKYKGRVPTAMKQADKVKALVDAGGKPQNLWSTHKKHEQQLPELWVLNLLIRAWKFLG